MEEFTDNDAQRLLELLRKYAEAYAPDLPQTIPAMAEDLAMSMDVTSDLADRCRVYLEAVWTV